VEKGKTFVEVWGYYSTCLFCKIKSRFKRIGRSTITSYIL